MLANSYVAISFFGWGKRKDDEREEERLRLRWRSGMDPKGRIMLTQSFNSHIIITPKLIKVYRIIVVVKTVRAESSFQIKIN